MGTGAELLGAQRLNRIETAGATGGEQGGDEGDGEKQEQHREEGRRLRRSHLEEDRGKGATERDRPDETDEGSRDDRDARERRSTPARMLPELAPRATLRPISAARSLTA